MNKTNPGRMTCKQRLAEALQERDAASKSAAALLAMLIEVVDARDGSLHTLHEARELIRKVKQGT